jgi:5-methylcytosine-specific restriction endonuclease McrA
MRHDPRPDTDQARVLRYLQDHVGEPVQLMTLACLIWKTEVERITRRLEQQGWPIKRERNRVTLLSLDRGSARGYRVPWDAMEREQVRRAAGYRCEICLRTEAELGYPLEIDHVRSVNRGGTTTLTNAQALCRVCNRKKQAMVGTLRIAV